MATSEKKYGDCVIYEKYIPEIESFKSIQRQQQRLSFPLDFTKPVRPGTKWRSKPSDLQSKLKLQVLTQPPETEISIMPFEGHSDELGVLSIEPPMPPTEALQGSAQDKAAGPQPSAARRCGQSCLKAFRRCNPFKKKRKKKPLEDTTQYPEPPAAVTELPSTPTAAESKGRIQELEWADELSEDWQSEKPRSAPLPGAKWVQKILLERADDKPLPPIAHPSHSGTPISPPTSRKMEEPAITTLTQPNNAATESPREETEAVNISQPEFPPPPTHFESQDSPPTADASVPQASPETQGLPTPTDQVQTETTSLQTTSLEPQSDSLQMATHIDDSNKAGPPQKEGEEQRDAPSPGGKLMKKISFAKPEKITRASPKTKAVASPAYQLNTDVASSPTTSLESEGLSPVVTTISESGSGAKEDSRKETQGARRSPMATEATSPPSATPKKQGHLSKPDSFQSEKQSPLMAKYFQNAVRIGHPQKPKAGKRPPPQPKTSLLQKSILRKRSSMLAGRLSEAPVLTAVADQLHPVATSVPITSLKTEDRPPKSSRKRREAAHRRSGRRK
ncbi:nascent polypeptide-associated complex subunit alpha, muscle-specific form-like isoform X4 [Hemicordylus capensis]|uniref:nascent polypeptide-associated complex subunit alpha, muscle-specific form-like isoform X4 n=1 Tax=Hemicordylus capensis TaxID=884348 RepID=UPI00230485BC|nr:nascent polypeptide-associated complex subunit alpha, muscle-specific form-like isoform X4 [Hemicordylus capensis]